MLVSEAPVADVRPLLGQERAGLLELLTALDPAEWTCLTPVPGWRVKDIALHLLDDDLGWLSRERDRDKSGLIDPSGEGSLVEALADKNQRWIEAATGLSLRLTCELLEWSGRRLDEFLVTADLAAPARVSWASDDAVPLWLDLAREFTERWVHHRQICEGLGRGGDGLDQYLEVVLNTFVWAFPHQYRVDAEPGTESGGRARRRPPLAPYSKRGPLGVGPRRM